jgi:DNA-binding response OmpR family regulator
MESCNITENPPLSLALWEPDDDSRNRTVHLLARLGFHVHGCRDAAGLFQWLDLRDPDLVLVGESAPVSQVVDAVLPRLSAHYGAGILVQAPDAGPQTRLSALQAGAHMCLDRRYEATELAALLRAQARRAMRQRRRPAAPRPPADAAGPAGPAVAAPAASAIGLIGSTDIAGLLSTAPGARTAGYVLRGLAAARVSGAGVSGEATGRAMPPREPWRVLYQGWVLITPTGTRIHLTGTERACFACLLDNPKRELSRAAMRGFMTATNLRSVNVAISRLRKKVSESGDRLPLHTVHGMGYVFVGELATQEQGA